MFRRISLNWTNFNRFGILVLDMPEGVSKGVPDGVEVVLVEDRGSPSGIRSGVPAWLDKQGQVFILGEDGQRYLVLPEGLGERVVSQVLGTLQVRHSHTI